ncbi:MAG: hypothetical protein BMS9Abin25_0611 [Gammaproteobacteria bacterium]|nr:MAG: hypothetical protein BMS9Abin25_0611 [Gammaproteobacteria bacterium]
MKVAYLIVAHHQPKHLAKLIRILDSDWAWFFIHIDGKSDIRPFIRTVPEQKKIHFLEDADRGSVNWAGFSVVGAVLSLLNRAYESEVQFDRFCLLSGSDFPVKSLDTIYEKFGSSIEYMRVDRKLTAERQNSHYRNVSHHYFTDSVIPEDRQLSGKIEREIYDRIDLYQGSAWWSLTRACTDYLIDFLELNPDYIDFHRTTFCPDEIFFHSIVKASPYARNLSHDFECKSDIEQYHLPNEHGCHYIDWNARGTRLPKVLNVDDACKLQHTNALFGRKFEELQSCQLLNILEQSIEILNMPAAVAETNHREAGQSSDQILKKIWLVGDARSGTTWLADLINVEALYQVIFEPFHLHRSRPGFKFEPYTYHKREEQDDELEKFSKKVFSGKVFSSGSSAAIVNPLCAENVLVKDVFAGLIAKWVLHRIPDLKIVVLLRHPFAIALSKRKLSEWNWPEYLSSLLAQKNLYDDFLHPYENVIRSAETFFERQIIIWTIMHYVMFQQLHEEDFHLVYYEDLCRQPEMELSRIVHYLGLRQEHVKKALRNINTASRMSSEDALRQRGRENYAVWQDEITEDELKRGCKILHTFGLDCIYNESPEPLKNGISIFRRKVMGGEIL